MSDEVKRTWYVVSLKSMGDCGFACVDPFLSGEKLMDGVIRVTKLMKMVVQVNQTTGNAKSSFIPWAPYQFGSIDKDADVSLPTSEINLLALASKDSVEQFEKLWNPGLIIEASAAAARKGRLELAK